MYSVYKHTCPNGKVYIGITRGAVNRRWKNGKGYSMQPLFNRAIVKYGWDNIQHEILCENLTEEEAKQKEVDLISFYKSNDSQYGYNCTAGGDGKSGVATSEETKERLRAAALGKKPDGETRKRMSEAQRRRFSRNPRFVSEETRQKMSMSRKGIASPNKGKFGALNKTSKRIVMYSIDGVLLGEYGSIQEAGRLHGVSHADISKCCSFKRKTAGGYIWRFADDCKNERIS